MSLAACTPDQTTAPDVRPARTMTAATLLVTNTNDAGPGSLRDVALTAPSGSLIQFAPELSGATITLASEIMFANTVLTIEAPASKGITISGGNSVRVLNIGETATLTLRNATITGGRAIVGGGIMSDGTLTIDHSTISGNTADHPNQIAQGGQGGGVYASRGLTTIVNSTVSGNSAYYRGGGISLSPNARVALINSTISYNTAELAGGIGLIASSGTLSVRNTILAYNSATVLSKSNCDDFKYATVTLEGRNITDTLECLGFETSDPKLAPLADNGGPTRTHALLAGSSAIDAAIGCTVTDDQRYFARPQGVLCDVGAVEFQYSTPRITIDAGVTVNSTTGVAYVTGTLSCASPVTLTLAVSLSQPTKAGKVNTTVAGSDQTVVDCTTSGKAWSVALTPATGAFSNGNGTASASLTNVPQLFNPASATAPVRMYWGHK